MINSKTINLYWKIGEEIYRSQQEKSWIWIYVICVTAGDTNKLDEPFTYYVWM